MGADHQIVCVVNHLVAEDNCSACVYNLLRTAKNGGQHAPPTVAWPNNNRTHRPTLEPVSYGGIWYQENTTVCCEIKLDIIFLLIGYTLIVATHQQNSVGTTNLNIYQFQCDKGPINLFECQ